MCLRSHFPASRRKHWKRVCVDTTVIILHTRCILFQLWKWSPMMITMICNDLMCTWKLAKCHLSLAHSTRVETGSYPRPYNQITMRQNSHITLVLKSLHWLKINERIKYKLLSLTYEVLTTNQLQYFRNLISVSNLSQHMFFIYGHSCSPTYPVLFENH